MKPTTLASRRVQWRMLTDGALVWAPFGEHGWRAATVTGLGKNRGDRTVVHLSFETGGKGRRVADELFWRKSELKGLDRPSRPVAESAERPRRVIDGLRERGGQGVADGASAPTRHNRQLSLFKP